MSAFMKHLTGAIIAIALFSVPAFAMQDIGKSSEMVGHGTHSTMKAEAEAHTDHMKDTAMDHANHAAGQTEEAMDHSKMDTATHDHDAIMKKAEEDAEQGIAKPVGIEEKLGNTLADVSFTDSEGNTVNLLELTRNIPTIVIPIYYRCPDVCTILQGSFAQVLPDVALKPGQEIQVVSISFDPKETTAHAARAKQTYAAASRGLYPMEHWKFLVGNGDEKSVQQWLDSIGYTVLRQGDIFAHPSAVVAIAPGGKVVRYLYGTSFLPFDITMAGTEAATGKIGLSIKRMLSFCYNYDPQGRRYVFSILRVSGFAIATFVGLFILYLVLSGRKHKKNKAK